jgi:hypothetical protein
MIIGGSCIFDWEAALNGAGPDRWTATRLLIMRRL